MNRAITLPNGDLYLEVKYRIADFRKKYPDGYITTEIINVYENMAVMKATVFSYEDKKVSEGYAMRYATETDPNFIEIAETVAIGRALSDAGFNIYSMEIKDIPDPTIKAIELDDGKKYLNVQYRVAWARRERPNLYIKKEILFLQQYHAVMKVTVMEGNTILSVAHARRNWQENDDGGRYFLECAETAAVGRALTLMGYDLPPEINAELSENNNYAEMPMFNQGNPSGQFIPPMNNSPYNSPEPTAFQQFCNGNAMCTDNRNNGNGWCN